ncbi:MAG: hypothetical protein M3N29_10380 [Chloroflexota bacterium]|nr:hypothetical protein [Chloroflexota bacterium]
MPAQPPPPSVGEQFGRTRSAFARLVRAHIALLRAEIDEIVGQVKQMAMLAGIAIALLLLMANMIYIGGFLFLGEWLFGSIGWGFAHGTLLALGLVVALALGIVGAGKGSAVTSVLIAALVAVGLALLLGSNAGHDTADYFAGQLPAPLNSASAVAALVGALIFGVLFALLLSRLGGATGAVGGLIIGVVVGLVLGYLVGGAPWTWPPAVGFAITVGLIAWPILNALLAWPGLDVGARFSRLYPRQTIDTVTETREWLEDQWRSRSPKPGKK